MVIFFFPCFISACLFGFFLNYFVLFCFFVSKNSTPPLISNEQEERCSLQTAIYPAVYLFPCRFLSFPCRLLPIPSIFLPIPCRCLPFPCRLQPFPCQLLPFPVEFCLFSVDFYLSPINFCHFPVDLCLLPVILMSFSCHISPFFCERDNFVFVLCNILQGRKKSTEK